MPPVETIKTDDEVLDSVEVEEPVVVDPNEEVALPEQPVVVDENNEEVIEDVLLPEETEAEFDEKPAKAKLQVHTTGPESGNEEPVLVSAAPQGEGPGYQVPDPTHQAPPDLGSLMDLKKKEQAAKAQQIEALKALKKAQRGSIPKPLNIQVSKR